MFATFFRVPPQSRIDPLLQHYTVRLFYIPEVRHTKRYAVCDFP